ncbi:MAG: hypothetical protein QM673_11795 [Gordonia sp. (in: high G+C Gram-positive bacteria)]
MTLLDDRRVDEETVTRAGRTAHAGGSSRRGRAGMVESQRTNRSRAAQRAIDRRRARLAEFGDVPSEARNIHGYRNGYGAQRVSLVARVRDVPFVVPVIALLLVGLGVSLWLSTKATQDSYRLGIERKENQALMDHRDSLKRTYESGDSAPELSDKAARLGMIPAVNPARVVIGLNGRSRVLGQPQPASGKPVGTINPADKPDPTSTIDKSKVDDSMGLAGASSRATHGQNAQTAPAPVSAPASAPAPALNPNVAPEAINSNPPVSGATVTR